VTDSFTHELGGLEDGLGLLPGSFCPHYDGEELRRPVYRRLVREGFPGGLAAEDGAAAHFVGTELQEVVASATGARVYRVDRNGERPLTTRVLDRVSLDVERGEMIALLGSSGCGKTTLLRAIAGFIRPESGSIRVGGRDITGLPPEKRNTAMMFQSYALWPT
jgi:ABC-type multidrug transport system fused ATPase/permease subunit